MKEESLYDVIDLYLDGELPKDHSFLKRLNNDQSLTQQVEVHRLLKEAVIDYRILNFQKVLTQHHINTQLAASRSLKRKYFIFALLLLSLAAAVIFIFKDKPEIDKNKNNKNLFPIKLHDSIISNPQNISTGVKNIDKNEIKADKLRKSLSFANKKIKKDINQIAFKKTVPETLVIERKSILSDTEKIVKIDVAKENYKKQDTCKNKNLKGSIISQPSCYGKTNGSITFTDVNGGTEPYTFSIDNGATYNSFNLFNNLSPGTYSISVKDRNNCSAIIDSNYILKSKHCISIKNLTFNPEYVGAIELPKGLHEGAIISISDKSGQVITTKTIPSNEIITWDGRVAGQLVLPGIYIYSIRYDSQSEEHGTISIMY